AGLRPERQRPRPPTRGLDQGTRSAVPPVRGGEAFALQAVEIGMGAEAEIVGPGIVARDEVEGSPTGAVQLLDRAGAAALRRGERHRRDALHIAVEVVEAADRPPVPAAGRAFEGER